MTDAFSVGALVNARGREWVVLPPLDDKIVTLRPLGGTDDEVTAIHRTLEAVTPASFAWPTAAEVGDHRSGQLLRDALRLGFRASAGPFRSFGAIAVEPRPYQLVPLLMALRQDPVRLLIADDVGIGKTVEAGLIARELFDRGEIQRIAVLCPPHLAEQWQRELSTKFHIEAELVLPSTVTRLERSCPVGQSLFDVYPFVVVSMDFIKSDRRRDEFLRSCPEFVIVDEAHGCAFDSSERSGKHQRHRMLKGLAQDPSRHLVLVTATPHSGKEGAFRSLLTLLEPTFSELPDDLSGGRNERLRQQVAQHFVQRRRADIRAFLDQVTDFPSREDAEDIYTLSPNYRRVFEQVLELAREQVARHTDNRRGRIHWWAALGMLRALASSPKAAAATLRARAANLNAENVEDVERIGAQMVLDLEEDDPADRSDTTPGADTDHEQDRSPEATSNRARLEALAKAADTLAGGDDAKLKKAVQHTKKLLDEGFRPVVFCRYIATAEYLGEELRRALPKNVEVGVITGTLPPAEREARVEELEAKEKKVLVCTDCLSEGINLQRQFSAVVHYDLSWNPTRHEQRAGRVDRYGQPQRLVRVMTLWGKDNRVDGVVLKVLYEKHRAIRKSLGVAVPVPGSVNDVIEVLFEKLLRPGGADERTQLALFDQETDKERAALDALWEDVAERERKSVGYFVQRSIHAEDVAQVAGESRAAIGSSVDVERFVKDAVHLHGGVISGTGPIKIDVTEAPPALRDSVGEDAEVRVRFALPVADNELHLNRTHPFVSGLSSYVLDSALDPKLAAIARRAGAIRTKAVEKRTSVLLVRLRFHIVQVQGTQQRPILAEDAALAAFDGTPDAPNMLSDDVAMKLLEALPDKNVNPDQARDMVQKVLDARPKLEPLLIELARRRGEALLAQHKRVRDASKRKHIQYRVEPVLPPDLLGVFVLLPAVA